MSERPSIGYIGLGNMGGPMASRLAAAGYEVHVCGRNPQRLDPVIAAGAIRCAGPREVAQRAEIVFTCVTDTAAVEEVALGPDGIAAGGRRDGLLIDMSTIAPDATARIAGVLDQRCGMRWIDAPVSGGSVGAAAGTLTIMAGGHAEDIDRVRPVLAHLGQRVTRMGSVGAGQTTKLINQVFVSCSMAMISEAFGLAARAGLDVASLPEALAGGRADSTMLQHFWPRLVAGDFAPTSSVTSIVKDIALVQELGRQVHAFMPLTGQVAEMNQWLIANGCAAEDINALYKLFRPGALPA